MITKWNLLNLLLLLFFPYHLFFTLTPFPSLFPSSRVVEQFRREDKHYYD